MPPTTLPPSPTTASALHTLLAHVVDYAGLFPPASLAMSDAARHYAAYRASDERWMLGRFVVPAARIGELVAAMPHDARDVANGASAPWELSVLLGPDVDGDVARAAGHARSARTHVSALELRVTDAAALASAATAADTLGVARALTFCEIPGAADAERWVRAASERGLALKLRTGGVTPDAFPSTDDVARFLHACAASGVPFKLTAGLHHPLRAEYPLTYEAGCPRGTMHGFLNALAATALYGAGLDRTTVAPLLEERDARALAFDAPNGALAWRAITASGDELAAARRAFVAFGSCSFTEPVSELRALGLLPAA